MTAPTEDMIRAARAALLSCPFCGDAYAPMVVSSLTGMQVMCRNCGGASGTVFNGVANGRIEAISAWNRRAAPAAIVARMKARTVLAVSVPSDKDNHIAAIVARMEDKP